MSTQPSASQFERRDEVDRVVTAQPQVFGMRGGADGKLLVDAHRDQLRTELGFELGPARAGGLWKTCGGGSKPYGGCH